ncbi:MAG TPA: RsmG family class I SAM-dependent methyltransferase [Solirubrobacteraceae bacterium]|jgi:16S rRNA (guanine527-N7)-methyltransferase|nr:RsmG family class I SAM-dependent methyltransferase [Solirubrobacteraceae bacterium]
MSPRSAGDDGVWSLLAGLAARHCLSEGQVDQFSSILRALAADEAAPTTVREPVHALNVHLADSLVALELEVVRGASRIADIGAGAGFPGLALAVALPSAEVKLVESRVRKCGFIEGVVEGSMVANAEVVYARAEEWAEGLGAHDLVVVRALGPQPVVLEYAAPLLRLGGALVDWRGRRDPEEERRAVAAADLLGLRLESVRRVEPYEGVRDHHLHVYLKVEETPERFPRRAGMARKKPLAA